MDDWFINYLVLMSDWNNTVAYCRWSLFKRHALKSLVFHEGDRSSPEVAQHLPSKSSIWWWRRLTRILSCHNLDPFADQRRVITFPSVAFLVASLLTVLPVLHSYWNIITYILLLIIYLLLYLYFCIYFFILISLFREIQSAVH